MNLTLLFQLKGVRCEYVHFKYVRWFDYVRFEYRV